jgi:hypothetical protein
LGAKLNSLKTEAGVDSLFLGLNSLNMLNTKYLIYNPEAAPLVNSKAMGSAWIVNSYKVVESADEEIAELKNTELKKEVIVNKKFKTLLPDQLKPLSPSSQLKLKLYSPNKLEYSYSGQGNEIAVFSEIYYPKGWNAYIKEKLVPSFQANYLLRAMVLPEGNYDITFKFEPTSYYFGKKISLFSSIILLLLIGFVLFKNLSLKINKD